MPAHLIELRICQHCIFPCPGFLLLIQGLRPKWKGQQLPCILVPNKPCPLKRQRSTLGRMLECFAATEATSKRGNENMLPPCIQPHCSILRNLTENFQAWCYFCSSLFVFISRTTGTVLEQEDRSQKFITFSLNWFGGVFLKYKIYSLVKDVSKCSLSYDQNFNCFP